MTSSGQCALNVDDSDQSGKAVTVLSSRESDGERAAATVECPIARQEGKRRFPRALSHNERVPNGKNEGRAPYPLWLNSATRERCERWPRIELCEERPRTEWPRTAL